MLFINSALLLLSTTALISAWEIKSVSDVAPKEHRNSGSGTSDCINRNHKREDPLKFRREGSSCCLHLYKEADCSLDERRESICRDYNQDTDFHFRSYYVDCTGRGSDNPPRPGDFYGPSSPQPPYDNRPLPPYNSPLPYNSPPPYVNSPQPYDNRPLPYNNGPAPYDSNRPPNSCRPGDRCYVEEEAETAN